jgi:hypothetical protein
LNSRSRESPLQSAAGEGEVFSDYDTSLVQSDYVGVSTSEASANAWGKNGENAAEGRDLEHMDIPVVGVDGAAPAARSFTAVIADDTQELDGEVSGTLNREVP